jgi:hypothetical protein
VLGVDSSVVWLLDLSSAVLSVLELSLFELELLSFLESSDDWIELPDELVTVLVTGAPSDVFVTLLTTILVADSAKMIDTTATGVTNGGIR